MSNVLGAKGLVAPGEEIHTTTLVKPSEIDLTPEGEYDPDCPVKDSDGIAVCRRFQPLVMFVGGAKDPEFGPVLRETFYPYNRDYESDQDIGYGAWQTGAQIKALALHWMLQGQKVVLVGHSYGGDTVMDIARELSASGKELEVVVTLDPVSRGGPRADQPKPKHVKKWLNVYVDYAKAGSGSANSVARLGGPWGSCANADENHVFLNGTGAEHAYANAMFSKVRSYVEAVK